MPTASTTTRTAIAAQAELTDAWSYLALPPKHYTDDERPSYMCAGIGVGITGLEQARRTARAHAAQEPVISSTLHAVGESVHIAASAYAAAALIQRSAEFVATLADELEAAYLDGVESAICGRDATPTAPASEATPEPFTSAPHPLIGLSDRVVDWLVGTLIPAHLGIVAANADGAACLRGINRSGATRLAVVRNDIIPSGALHAEPGVLIAQHVATKLAEAGVHGYSGSALEVRYAAQLHISLVHNGLAQAGSDVYESSIDAEDIKNAARAGWKLTGPANLRASRARDLYHKALERASEGGWGN